MSVELPSLVVCGPQLEEIPDATYLARLRSSLLHDPYLRSLKQEALELHEMWPLLSATEPSLARFDAAPLLHSFAEWIRTGDSHVLRLAGGTLRNTQLALLTVLAHLLEYTTYLQHRHHHDHAQSEHAVLTAVHDGGVQGLSIGVLSAIAISCSQSRMHLASYGAVALRLAVCAGAWKDLDEMHAAEPPVCLEARWEGGGARAFKAVLDSYPQAYAHVREDASSATVIVPESSAAAMARKLEEDGIEARQVGLQGLSHRPDHFAACQKLFNLCSSLPMLRFPEHCHPLVPLTRNGNAEAVDDGASLHEMALRCILLEKPDWAAITAQCVAAISRQAGEPRVLLLGRVECIPRSVPARLIRPMAAGHSLYVYPDESIAIVGASCRFAGSETPAGFWDTLRERSEEEPFWGNFLASAGAFDHAFFRKSPREAAYMDPQHRLALHLAYEALESGGYFNPAAGTQTYDVGCYVGVYSSDYEDNVNARPPTPFSFTGTARAFASGRISQFFGWTGPSLIVDTACSSSGVAIHTACKAIQSGECTMALAGGVNLMTSPKSHQNLAAASLMSRTGQCKPFDASADGYCRGEGGGFVLLKRLSSAVADNDRVLGVLAASAINNSKGSLTITAPSLESQAALYQSVLRKAGMQPDQVSYVEAHGTGTQKGDPVECHSLRRVFGRSSRNSPPLRFGSVKGNIGHSEGASGVASLVKVLLMLQHGLIAPQANFSVLNPAAPNLEEANMEIPLYLQPWDAAFRAACVNNYGAAGNNTAMIVCQPPATQPVSRPSSVQKRHQYPFMLTAHSDASLRQHCRILLQFVEDQQAWAGDDLLASLAFHLAQRQSHQLGYRTAFSARSIDDLKARLGEQNTQTRGNCNPVVLVFAGQTGHRPRLSEEAYHSSFLLQHHLDRCDRTLQTLGLRGLFPQVFGTQAVDDLVDLHCMLFSIQYATAAAWIDAGLDVRKLVGHSLGQLTALCVARVLTLRDALKMISGRAALIQSKWGPEQGCMLSVDSDAVTVRALIDSMASEEKVEIACYNAPSSHVVVGKAGATAAFESAALSAGVRTKRLAITHAFHSPMVDSIMEDYESLLRELQFHSPTIPIEPCEQSGGSWENLTPERVARQSRAPVYFGAAVSRVERELGSCVWLEAGAGPAGVTMARRAASSSSHAFLSARLGSPDAMDSLADTTLSLWREGVRVQFWPFHPWQRHCFRLLELPPYQFETTHHWLPFASAPESAAQQPTTANDVAPQLVSVVRSSGGADPEAAEFTINQHSEEYAVFVGGRTVLGHALSPPSVYLESAARALGLVSAAAGGPAALPPHFEQVQLHAPLGIDPRRRIRLRLHKHNTSAWEFVFDSQAPALDGGQTFQLQASGIIKSQEQDRAVAGPYRPLLRRLIDHERCRVLLEDSGASVVQGAFVKNILGRVASYEDSYFGIRSITSKGHEAVGVVDVPEIAHQRCAETRVNPPLLDNFMLVAEMHAGNLDACGSDQMYVCNGFDALVPHSNDGSLRGPFTVYSKLERESDRVFVGDVFVLTGGQKTLSLAILGARFSKVPVRSLQRALEAANGSPNVRTAEALDHSAVAIEARDSALTSPPIRPHAPPSSDAVSTISLNEHGMTAGRLCQEIHSRLSGVPQLSPHDTDRSSDLSAGQPPSTPKASTQEQEHFIVELSKLLAEHLNCSPDIPPETPLALMGLDSLLAIQLASDMESRFGKKSSPMNIDENTTFSDLCRVLSGADLPGFPRTSDNRRSEEGGVGHVGPEKSEASFFREREDVIKLEFDRAKQRYGLFSEQAGLAGFYARVYPRQVALVLAYIVEAFRTLGCDVATLRAGERLPPIPHEPRYEKLVRRYLQLLEDAGLITSSGEHPPAHLRTAKALEHAESSRLHRAILADFPAYRPDHRLLQLTGPRLADCVSGKVDPLQLLFHGPASRQLLEAFYVSSPMFATATRMMSEFVGQLLRKHGGCSERLRVLEVGAGTGATTHQLLDQLVASGAAFTYTFTDVSSSLVAAARRRLEARYAAAGHEMHFAVLDIERPPPQRLLHSQDLVVASNVLHATRSLSDTCSNVQRLLRPGCGVLCLLELTRPLPWLDCVFGLLDGWWRFADSRTYPLVDEWRWKACLLNAGFRHVDWTDDESREADLFRWILALA
ncbi:hypothetical protein B0J12DRAFT_578190 [Macrophomina phaseolina]|uniref:Beta-ketoacyl synthase n=1 Tax=Macrophomina phaseolina TaxID=35725 RepID=A0ABQ8G454_9PEZI|nr:hypothetical protein B0J12DRAFT_578190 [Macrophomina phaseolina]